MVSSTENTEMNWAWDSIKVGLVISEMIACTGVVPHLSPIVVLNCVVTFGLTWQACSTVQHLQRQIVMKVVMSSFVLSSDSLSGIGSNHSCSLCHLIWKKWKKLREVAPQCELYLWDRELCFDRRRLRLVGDWSCRFDRDRWISSSVAK